MGDPFSIASGAAGIFSLGITLCSNLAAYCSDYKNADTELLATSRQLENIKMTIMHLQESLERSPASRIEVFGGHLSSVRAGIRSLEVFWKRLHDGVTSENKFRKHSQKALYHFQKVKLNELQQIAQSLQNDLGLAFQLLQ